MEASMASGLGSLCCTIQLGFFFKWWNEGIPMLSECNIFQHQISFPLERSINSTVYCLYTFFPHNMLTQGNKQDKALASFTGRFEMGWVTFHG